VRFVGDIEVRAATPDEAKLLRIPKGQPVFVVLRTAYDAQDRPAETCANILSATQWRLSYGWRQDQRTDGG
jgi:GntR family transcriptional regulator